MRVSQRLVNDIIAEVGTRRDIVRFVGSSGLKTEKKTKPNRLETGLSKCTLIIAGCSTSARMTASRAARNKVRATPGP
jgi:hypothetical protein